MYINHERLSYRVSGNEEDMKKQPRFNPLAEEAIPRWYEFYKRVKLLPWWIRYNVGIARESILKDKIIELCKNIGLNNTHARRLIRHAVSEFSKNGLGSDYYGYHNINHELEVTYFTLLAIIGLQKKYENRFNQKDIETQPFKIDLDIVIALIHRTAYPFKDSIAEYARKRMSDLFTEAGIPENDINTRKHYEELGWFLSICDRIAGYCLGNFEYSKELARLNAHAMGWHPSIINENSVNYFAALKEEKSVLEQVLQAIPEEFKKNFYDNVAGFREAWENEVQIRAMLRRKELNLVTAVENTDYVPTNLINSIMKMHKEIHAPISPNEVDFKKSLCAKETILITLRTNTQSGHVVGYVNGGPLERYKLRRGTYDENFGRKNTVYMEWIRIKPEYLGETGGHLLRSGFLNEARRRRYEFVSSYVHRDVIANRMNKGESIETVQKYDPDKLDYYRANLSKLVRPMPLV